MNLTKIYLHVWYFEGYPCLCISRTDFWQFSEKIKKLFPRIPFSFFDPVFALRRCLNNPRTPCAHKCGFGPFWGENYGLKTCGQTESARPKSRVPMKIICWCWLTVGSWIMFVVFLYKTFRWCKYVCIKKWTCKILQDFIVWPKCLGTKKSRDRNGSDRNGQTEKSRTQFLRLSEMTTNKNLKITELQHDNNTFAGRFHERNFTSCLHRTFTFVNIF